MPVCDVCLCVMCASVYDVPLFMMCPVCDVCLCDVCLFVMCACVSFVPVCDVCMCVMSV